MLADDEKDIERGRLVVLPLEADYILQFSLLYAAPADIHGDIFILVRVLQKLPDRVYRVPVQFLDAWGGEGHGYDAVSDICKIEVVAVLLKSVFGAANYLSQEVHFITSNNKPLATFNSCRNGQIVFWARESSQKLSWKFPEQKSEQ